ncbi:hypothetical protein BaRGS_00021575, partial [Batillaria attramentaria]
MSKTNGSAKLSTKNHPHVPRFLTAQENKAYLSDEVVVKDTKYDSRQNCSAITRDFEIQIIESSLTTTPTAEAFTVEESKYPGHRFADDQESQRETRITRASGSQNLKGVTNPASECGNFGWVMVAASFLCYAIVDGTGYGIAVFFETFRDHFASSNALTAWIGSALFGTQFVVATSVFASTFSGSISLLIVTFGVLGGVGFGCIRFAATVSVGHYFVQRRALATGIMCCGGGTGLFVFPPFLNFLMMEFGWKGALWIHSGVVLNGVVLGFAYGKRKQKKTTEIPKKELENEVSIVGDGRVQELHTSDQKAIAVECTRNSDVIEKLQTSDQDVMTEEWTRNSDVIEQQCISGQDMTAGQSTSNSDVIEKLQTSGQDVMTGQWTRKSDVIEQQRISGQDTTAEQCTRNCDVIGSVKDSVAEAKHKKRRNHRLCFAGPSFLDGFCSLAKSPSFLLYWLSVFFCTTGQFIPTTFLPPLAHILHVDSTLAAFLVSVVGMASTVGRVVFGWLSDMRWANPLVTNGVTLAVGGVATSLVPFVKTYSQLAAFSALYGACMGAFVTLRIPILVKLLGPHRLADSFGFLCLAHGLGAFAGPPLAGATIGFSGVLSLYLCWISRRANPNTYAFEFSRSPSTWTVFLFVICLTFPRDSASFIHVQDSENAPDDVIEAFQQLMDSLDADTDETLSDFLVYFESTWLGIVQRGRRRRPKFDVAMWNVYNRVEDNLPRTNNSVEGWHRAFDQRMSVTHPTLGRLVSKLRKEQASTELMIEQHAMGVRMRKNKQYEVVNTRLQALVARYAQVGVVLGDSKGPDADVGRVQVQTVPTTVGETFRDVEYDDKLSETQRQ